MKVKSKYASDGVDVEEESLFSQYASFICKASYKNSPYVKVQDFSVGNFRGPRPFLLKGLPRGISIEATTDGIGTKGIIIDAAKSHEDAAYDIVAMTASDISRFGGLPLVFVNVLDTVSIGEAGNKVGETYKKVLRGLGRVAKKEKIVVLKGETAQMGVSLGSEITNSKTKINWSGTMIGAYHRTKMITGGTLKNGQIVIALKENGFRCNGISSVRKALAFKFGKKWWNNPRARKSIKEAATPSVLYDPLLTTLNGWFRPSFKQEIKVHAIVHLSGGAIKEKFAKDILFPRGLSASLNDLWEPPTIMRSCAEWRSLSDEEFYETWNGGQGVLMVIDEKDVKFCLKRAKQFSIQARVAGRITKEKVPQVEIVSKLTQGKKIIYKTKTA
ncbi:MAG: AIR synthase-related protein [bacterium]|nr:AIR synthase-related protein [bacterium]